MMHVSVAADARYVPHAAAMMHSVLEHCEGVQLHLLHAGGLPAEQAGLLRTMVEGAGGTLSVHELEPASIAGLPDRSSRGISATMWLRVFLPELLPDIERVLYLDADTIAVAPLAPLWETDLAGGYVAAVENVWEPWNAGHPAKLGVARYFNSGVLLMNLELMRRDACSAALLDAARTRELVWPDQDALNLVLGEQRVELHPRWNAMNSVMAFAEAVEVFGAERVEEARARPGIRHFEGQGTNKPWHLLCEQPGREEYLRHRAATPWPKLRREGMTPGNLVRAATRRLRA